MADTRAVGQNRGVDLDFSCRALGVGGFASVSGELGAELDLARFASAANAPGARD